VDGRADFVANGLVRGDRGGHGDHAVARQQAANEADATNVGVAVFLAEAESLGEVRANDVAVENLNLGTAVFELLLKNVGDGGLARTGQTGEPECKAFMCHCYLLTSISDACNRSFPLSRAASGGRRS